MIVLKNDNETINEAFKKTLEECKKKKAEHRQPKNWDDKFINYFDGFVRIIYGDTFVNTIMTIDEPTSFRDLLNRLNIKYTTGTIHIWLESYLKGEIWMYGNYPESKFWWFHGETNGFC